MSEPRTVYAIVKLTEEEARLTERKIRSLGTALTRRVADDFIAALARTGKAWEGYEIPPEQACGLRAVHEAEEFDGSRRVTVIPNE